MNLNLSSLNFPETPTLHILLEHNDQGNAIATVLELPNCQAEAPTREQALEALKQRIETRLEKAEILSVEIQPTSIPENPWMKFAGIFKDDPQFDEFQQCIQDYRQEIDAHTDEAYLEASSVREDL
jgi:predicted RNase H-like HicB family nuclease